MLYSDATKQDVAEQHIVHHLGGMTELAQPSRKALEAKPGRQLRDPSGKVRAAVDLMVWQGHHRDDAARAAGMLPKSLYNAFRKHHVRQFYLSQLEVLRTSARARAFHRIEELSQQDAHRAAAVKACQVILDLPDAELSPINRAQSPGFIVQVVSSGGETRILTPGQTIDARAEPVQSADLLDNAQD